MPELLFIVSYLCLGVFVGFFAGLLGIGGGGIMVPMLTGLFLLQEFPHEHVVHIALATSMAAIIFTAISSVYSQQKKQAILWPVVLSFSPGIIIGTFVTAYFVSLIETKALAIIFAILMAVISIKMALNQPTKPTRQLPSSLGQSFAGFIIGSLSALIAIAGGSLTVPYLTWCNVAMKKAIATSSGIGLTIAISGMAGYILGGHQQVGLPDYSTGYIYWPAVILIAIVSIFTAPIGVNMAHKLPVPLLKKVFAVLLMGLSLKMLFSI